MRRSSRTRKFARIAAIAVLAASGIVLSGTLGANAQSDSASSQIIYYPPPKSEPPLSNVTTATEQATKGDDGACHYSRKLPSGDQPVYSRMTSLNPDTCVYTVESGTPAYPPSEVTDPGSGDPNSAEQTAVSSDVNCSAPDLEKDDQATLDVCGSGQATGGVRTLPAQASKPKSARYTHHNLSVTYESAWDDPAGYDVNWVRVALHTNTSGVQIISADCMYHYYYLDYTGWEVDSGSTVSLCEASATYAQKYVEMRFLNYAFCPYNDPTGVDYLGVIASADINYSYGWTDNTYAWGGCASLLDWWDFYQPFAYY